MLKSKPTNGAGDLDANDYKILLNYLKQNCQDELQQGKEDLL